MRQSRQKLKIRVQSQFSRQNINLIILKMLFLSEYQIRRTTLTTQCLFFQGRRDWKMTISFINYIFLQMLDTILVVFTSQVLFWALSPFGPPQLFSMMLKMHKHIKRVKNVVHPNWLEKLLLVPLIYWPLWSTGKSNF